MTMVTLAKLYAFVVGVDTHARTHTYTVLTAEREHIDTATFPNTQPGRSRAIAWVGRRTGGDLATLWVIEGTGSYGALLAGLAQGSGYDVIEAPRVIDYARARTRVGKSDPIDARAIATAAVLLEPAQQRIPRHGAGARAGLRVLLGAREHMTFERTAKVNALTALLRSVDLGVDARSALSPPQLRRISQWRKRDEDLSIAIARTEAKRLAQLITVLDAELKENQTHLTELLQATPAGVLLDEVGIGPVNAAILYTAWSHRGRVRSEAAFATLAGVNPIPASSGNTIRHRLNRGGDRCLNSALHMAVVVRTAHDPTTREYVARRTAEGKSPREIRRCLKRYLARALYRKLNAVHRIAESTDIAA